MVPVLLYTLNALWICTANGYWSDTFCTFSVSCSYLVKDLEIDSRNILKRRSHLSDNT